MHKTTVIANSCTHQPGNGKPTTNLNFPQRSFRYLLAILPIALILLISTSYQQDKGDYEFIQEELYSPAVRTALKEKLSCMADMIQFTGNMNVRELQLMNDFYAGCGYKPVWVGSKGLTSWADELVNVIERAREFGLEPENYHMTGIRNHMVMIRNKAFKSKETQIDLELEVMLTNAAIHMMINLHAGYRPLDSSLFDAGWVNELPEILKKGIAMQDVLESILSVEPRFSEYQKLRKANALFIRSNALNDPINATAYPGTDSLRKISMYQYRVLALNLDRLRKMPYADSSRLYINVPAYSLKIFKDNLIMDTFRVIVGSPASRTPLLTGTMQRIIVNPCWYVPKSIAINEILPKIREDSTYLERNGFRVLDQNYNLVNAEAVNLGNTGEGDFSYTFRQDRGLDNSLGIVKFIFSNPHAVYLHDTPGKALFQKDLRAFSHGCIRVEHPERLAGYILAELNSDTTRFESLIRTGQQHDIPVKYSLPVHITYITCEGDNEGKILFYKDIYDMDKTDLEALSPFMGI